MNPLSAFGSLGTKSLGFFQVHYIFRFPLLSMITRVTTNNLETSPFTQWNSISITINSQPIEQCFFDFSQTESWIASTQMCVNNTCARNGIGHNPIGVPGKRISVPFGNVEGTLQVEPLTLDQIRIPRFNYVSATSATVNWNCVLGFAPSNTSLMNQIANQTNLDSNTLTYSNYKGISHLVFGGIDRNSYTEPITWIPTPNNKSWELALKSVSFNNQKVNVKNLNVTFLSNYNDFTLLPLNLARDINSRLNLEPLPEIFHDSTAWGIRCELLPKPLPDMVIELDGYNMTLKSDDYLLETVYRNQPFCFSTILGFTESKNLKVSIGTLMLRSMVVSFDFKSVSIGFTKSISNSLALPNLVPISTSRPPSITDTKVSPMIPDNDYSTNSVGLTVLIIVIVILSIAILMFVCLMFRRLARRFRPKDTLPSIRQVSDTKTKSFDINRPVPVAVRPSKQNSPSAIPPMPQPYKNINANRDSRVSIEETNADRVATFDPNQMYYYDENNNLYHYDYATQQYIYHDPLQYSELHQQYNQHQQIYHDSSSYALTDDPSFGYQQSNQSYENYNYTMKTNHPYAPEMITSVVKEESNYGEDNQVQVQRKSKASKLLGSDYAGSEDGESMNVSSKQTNRMSKAARLLGQKPTLPPPPATSPQYYKPDTKPEPIPKPNDSNDEYYTDDDLDSESAYNFNQSNAYRSHRETKVPELATVISTITGTQPSAISTSINSTSVTKVSRVNKSPTRDQAPLNEDYQSKSPLPRIPPQTALQIPNQKYNQPRSANSIHSNLSQPMSIKSQPISFNTSPIKKSPNSIKSEPYSFVKSDPSKSPMPTFNNPLTQATPIPNTTTSPIQKQQPNSFGNKPQRPQTASTTKPPRDRSTVISPTKPKSKTIQIKPKPTMDDEDDDYRMSIDFSLVELVNNNNSSFDNVNDDDIVSYIESVDMYEPSHNLNTVKKKNKNDPSSNLNNALV
ncbi:hypothetical protein BC833DRAFT_573295 [Globomyces pollinis-pini]|nr:hypothetical protein BC833DRAFT_573295 [Globomyces pollinis-pini]